MIYVGHSDPRIGGGPSGSDLNLDTNSSMISRLTWTGSTWQKLDLVRGLPRSEENHAANGMQLDPVNNILYVAMGGNTNKGATSNNFALLPEFALSAAILSIDLTAIGNTTYDLPTLDDETRSGQSDANDPFGGNDGKNQAMHRARRPGAGVRAGVPQSIRPRDHPVGPDVHHRQRRQRRVGRRAHRRGAGRHLHERRERAGHDQPRQPALHHRPGLLRRASQPDPRQHGQHVQLVEPAVAGHRGQSGRVRLPRGRVPKAARSRRFVESTNGLAEYTTSNFGGAMQGNLLAASFGNTIYRIQLNPAGTMATVSSPLLGGRQHSARRRRTRPRRPFPGTIWVGDYGSNQIIVFEPNDFAGGPPPCTGADNPALDEDDDGYDNADEIDNGTSPCSAADVPPDADDDFTSDLNDPDDDNDGDPDVSDPFALDRQTARPRTCPSTISGRTTDRIPGASSTSGSRG